MIETNICKIPTGKSVKNSNRFFKASSSCLKTDYLLRVWKPDEWVLLVGMDSYKIFVTGQYSFLI